MLKDRYNHKLTHGEKYLLKKTTLIVCRVNILC